MYVHGTYEVVRPWYHLLCRHLNLPIGEVLFRIQSGKQGTVDWETGCVKLQCLL